MPRLPTTRFALAAALLGAAALVAGRHGAAEEPAPAPSIHAPWDRILKAVVAPGGRVDYEAVRKSHAGELAGYLETLAGTNVDRLGSREARKAFWLNAYNALCVRTLIDAGLPAEVPHAILFGRNIFTQRTYRIAGELRSLDEIEHQILRPGFADPRLHAAVACGALSSPGLRPEAFEGKELDRQLDEQCRSWIAVETTGDPKRKNYFDEATKTLHLSRVFSWYVEDFGGRPDRLLEFVRQFADDATRQLLETTRVRIVYLPYDWSLNRP